MDKVKKRALKRYVTWAFLAGLVLLLTAMPLLAKSSVEAEGPVASVLSATVESGSIQEVLKGGGTLTSDSVDIRIPEEVRITEYLVKNGDHVSAGTPVAAVDKVSVLAAMAKVEETLDYLRDKIEGAKDETVSDSIYATAGGRIKKVFAKAGESVQDVMLRDGALALLSVDGKMAVRYEVKSDISTGETVTILLADGTEVTGRVESNLDGAVIVTVEDEGYEIGTPVTVEELGTGNLYVHNAWKATGYSGTIGTVSAREEKTVSSGAILFTLKDTDYAGQWEYRMGQHREYEELLQRLTKMYESGTVDAPCAGVISGVDEDSAWLLAAQQGNGEAVFLSNMQPAYQVILLSSVTCTGNNPSNSNCAAQQHVQGCPNYTCLHAVVEGVCKAGTHERDCIEYCNPANCSATGTHKPGCITFCPGEGDPAKCPNPVNGNHKPDCIHQCISSQVESGLGKCPGGKNHYTACIESCDEAKTENDACHATGKHKNTCIRSCVQADITGVCRTDPNYPHYIECIESCTENSTCPAAKHKPNCSFYGMSYTAQVAKVDSVGNTELVVYWDASGTQYPAKKTGSGWKLTGQFEESLLVARGTLSISNAQQVFHKGDILLAITGYQGGKAAYSTIALYRSAPAADTSGGMAGMMPDGMAGLMPGGMAGLMPGGMAGMMGGFGSYGNAAGQGENLYDLEGETLLTVIPQETMTITISLDEQDIGKVSLDMEATVKVDALRGRTYPAEVTAVGFSGANDGGSSKFPVELTLNVDQDMLDGMSTTAQIVLETRENIPVIPLAALDGDSTGSVVYTSLDKESGEPANPVKVETGVSDGEKVEILSGLNVGDTVYYQYYDVLELDTAA